MAEETTRYVPQPSNRWLYGMLVALFLSNTGTFLQFAAQAWVIWERTHSPTWLGRLALVQATPLLGVPLIGGSLADRFARRTVLLCTQAALALVSGGMGIQFLTGTLTPLRILILAGCLATVAAIDNPVRQVYLPGVVGQDRRGWVVGLNASAYNGGAILGAALAGLLLNVTGAGWCFLLNSLSYLVAFGWLFRGPAGRPMPSQKRTMRAVAVYLRHSPQTQALLLLVVAVSLFGRSYPHLLPALVTRRWGGGTGAYGTLAALPGIGALVAAGLSAWWLKTREASFPWGGAVLLGCSIAVLGTATTLPVACVLLALVGLAATGTMTLVNAGVQVATPDSYRGRIMSLYTLLAAGMPPLGGWLLGTLSADIGLQTALLIAGLLLAALALLLSRDRMRRQVIEHVPAIIDAENLP